MSGVCGSWARWFCGDRGILFTSEDQAKKCINDSYFRISFAGLLTVFVMIIISIVILPNIPNNAAVYSISFVLGGLIFYGLYKYTERIPINEWKVDEKKINDKFATGKFTTKQAAIDQIIKDELLECELYKERRDNHRGFGFMPGR